MTSKLTQLLLSCMVLTFSAGQAVAKSDAADSGYYTAKDKEFYLTSDEIFFIRPGLDLEIVDFTIPADMQPEVTFTLTDPGGLALDMDGVATPGPIDTMRYMLTAIPQGQEQKVIMAGFLYDRGGTLTELEAGKYLYKFATVLGDNYDPDATHTLGLHARRDLTEYELGYYVDEEVLNVVPSGNSEPRPREIVTTETCNGRCHDPLGMHESHGGPFTDVEICTQCHNPTIPFGDPEVFNFNILIHSVHAEAHSYPTEINDCQVCHTGGTPTENFPLVASPNPVPVCDGSGKGQTTLSWDFPKRYEVRIGAADGKLFASGKGEGSAATGKWTRDMMEFFVVDPASGETVQQLGVDNTVFGCMDNAPYSAYGEPGALHTNWMDHPSRLVCGSCHSYINWETGEGHSELNFPIDNDDVCAGCHKAYSGMEFDRSVWGAHLPFLSSSQFPGLIVEILDVTDTDPGDNPTVHFKLRTKNGPISPNMVSTLRFSFWGPNEDFTSGDPYSDFNESVVGKAVKMADHWAYTFEASIPADAEGSYTLGVEGGNDVEIVIGLDETEGEHDTIESLAMPFAVTDAEPMARRMVVDDAKCEACHANLTLHGNNRRNVNYCITCHRPERLDVADPAENVSMKWMIHKIHAGAELENGYTVKRMRYWLSPPSLGTYVFDDIEFSGDLRNCEKCHVNDSYMLPLPSGLLDTLTPNQFWSPTGPASAACLSCHDSVDAQAHAYSNITFFGESCATCHGAGADFDVEKVHAR